MQTDAALTMLPDFRAGRSMFEQAGLHDRPKSCD
jgi:hypothetical protein